MMINIDTHMEESLGPILFREYVEEGISFRKATKGVAFYSKKECWKGIKHYAEELEKGDFFEYFYRYPKRMKKLFPKGPTKKCRQFWSDQTEEQIRYYRIATGQEK